MKLTLGDRSKAQNKVCIGGFSCLRSMVALALTGVRAALAQQLMPHLQQVHPRQQLDHMRASNGSNPREQNIDPAISGPRMMRTSPGDSGGDDNGAGSDGRKTGKRELSTSKRAAQNISFPSPSRSYAFGVEGDQLVTSEETCACEAVL